jgi:hypothetical protein
MSAYSKYRDGRLTCVCGGFFNTVLDEDGLWIVCEDCASRKPLWFGPSEEVRSWGERQRRDGKGY